MSTPEHGESRRTDMRHLFTTRTHSWREAGLARQLSRRAVKRARIQSLVLLPLLAGVLVLYTYREDVFGSAYDVPVRIGTFLALIALGWQFARDIGKALGPMLFRRMDPGTAGTVGFLIRLATVVVAVIVALRIAGLGPRTLALGGAFTAVVLGLAAQQTLGNLFAGTVLLSARPFRVGERVRLQGGGLAGTVEGVVSSLGLLYTTLSSGDDQIMVPNSVVLNVAIVPLREPEGIDLRARLRPGVTPARRAGAAPGDGEHADARDAADRAGGGRRRRGRRPHLGHAGAPRRRLEARRRGARGRRLADCSRGCLAPPRRAARRTASPSARPVALDHARLRGEAASAPNDPAGTPTSRRIASLVSVGDAGRPDGTTSGMLSGRAPVSRPRLFSFGHAGAGGGSPVSST